MATERTVYGAADLHRLADPKVVAVVGASEQPGSFGQRTIANLAGFAGRVYGVNPKYREVAGRPCVPGLRDLPEAPDCIALCVARPLVEAAVRDAIAIGAGGAIVYASGFAETGLPERKTAQEDLARLAQQGSLPLVGPNCVGIANGASGAAITFMPDCGDMISGRTGPIAIVSQSGALGYALLQAMHRGIGVSHYFAAGNSADVDVCDYIAYLAEVPHVRAIACLFEGVKSGHRFLEAARRVDGAGKALIVYKAGNSETSGKAAFSHTGTMVGSIAAYRAAFDEVGAIAVDDLEAMMELASLLSKGRAPRRGRGVGIIATSGGAGVINADKAEEAGLALPALAPQTRRALESVVPDFGAIANPADLTAEVLKSSTSFAHCLDAFANDPGFSALVVPLVFAHAASSGSRAPTICDVAARTDSLVVATWMNEWLEGPGSATLEKDPNVVVFRSPQRCFNALRIWFDWHERRQQSGWTTRAPRRSAVGAAADARAVILAHRQQGRALSEQASKRLLTAYGIATPSEHLVQTPDEAATAAQRIGFPVAVKVASADIPHKTEVDGVRLNLGSAEAVSAAAAEVMAAARSRKPEAQLEGISVQSMVPPGTELVLGIRIDSTFGPMVVVGLGGIMVELLHDTATCLAPITPDSASRALKSLRGYALLRGFRGRPAQNVEAVVDILCRLSELACDLSDLIDEADINPLIVTSSGAIAADALFILASERGP